MSFFCVFNLFLIEHQKKKRVKKKSEREGDDDVGADENENHESSTTNTSDNEKISNGHLELVPVNEMNTSEPEEFLKCDECEQKKNLWLCLREDCMFVGCGGTRNEISPKHSTHHAEVNQSNNIKLSYLNEILYVNYVIFPTLAIALLVHCC